MELIENEKRSRVIKFAKAEDNDLIRTQKITPLLSNDDINNLSTSESPFNKNTSHGNRNKELSERKQQKYLFNWEGSNRNCNGSEILSKEIGRAHV